MTHGSNWKWTLLLAAAACASTANAWAQSTPTARLHPPVEPLDALGTHAFANERPVDANTTCGQCHDTGYITAHSSHAAAGADLTCFDCHVTGLSNWSTSLDERGFVRQEVTGIHRADTATCAKCHQVVLDSRTAPSLPDDFFSIVTDESGHDNYAMTRNTGALYTPRRVADSTFAVEGKERRTYAFDVHAERLLSCTDCHFPANHLQKAAIKGDAPAHLRRDTRSMPIYNYLWRPDHRLTTPDCTYCHDPLQSHPFLPYVNRHLYALDCQACHIPDAYGPLLMWVDETVVDEDDSPMTGYRNGFDAAHPNGVHGPPAPTVLLARETGASPRFGAYNLVTRYYWVDGKTGEKVSQWTVSEALSDDRVIAVLDKNGDGELQNAERHLRTDKQVAAMAAALRDADVTDPRIAAVIEAHRLAHGVAAGKRVRRNCEDCHSPDSHLTADVVLSTRQVADLVPQPVGDAVDLLRTGAVERTEAAVTWRRTRPPAPAYVFGLSKMHWSDHVGFLVFVLVFAGVLTHAAIRIFTRKKRPKNPKKTRREYLYSAYERTWHWLMAAAVLGLLVTGFKIHYPRALSSIGFEAAVHLHNFLAFVLILNAGLSLFFHLATAAIRQFVPDTNQLVRGILDQVRYYTWGIFLGHDHPTEKTPHKKLNPLQQLTYLGLLNVLFPLQIATGLALFAAAHYPTWFASWNGLSIIAPVHNLGSWLFLTFFSMHVYLTTTGHTVFSNIEAMVTGYDIVDEEEEAPAASPDKGENP